MNTGLSFTTRVGYRWAFHTLVGMALISLTTAYGGVSEGEGADSPLVVLTRLSLPVLVMIKYAVSEYKRALRSGLETLRAVRVAQLADSLYFIGFLWTLWALIDSFVIHQLSIAQAVFRAFGYALVTTTCGTFLRLMLLQFQESDDLVEVGSRRIEQDIDSFSTTLAKTGESVKAFQTDTDAALKTWMAALTAATESLTASTSSVNKQVSALHRSLTKLSEYNEALATGQTALVAQIDSGREAARERSNAYLTKLSEHHDSLATAHAKLVAEIDIGRVAARDNNLQLRNEIVKASGDFRNSLGENIRILDEAVRKQEQEVSRVMVQGAGRIGNVIDTHVRDIEVSLRRVADAPRFVGRREAPPAKPEQRLNVPPPAVNGLWGLVNRAWVRMTKH